MRQILNLLLLLSLYCIASADAPVRVPYASLYRALEPGLVIEEFDGLVARQRILSRNVDVTPSQIKVRILSGTGVIEVPILPSGDIRFPMSSALLKENPWVESNQPKGSLNLSATMELRLSQSTEYKYADIYASAMQAQQALAGLGPVMSGRRVRSVEFWFDRQQSARAELIDDRAEELLITDASGVLELRIDEALVKRHAVVKFSHLPRAARPHID